MFCLSLFGQLEQNVTGWVAYKQQNFISDGSGRWQPKVKVPAQPHSFIRALIPLKGTQPS